jgi:hypothetical protein
MAVHTGGVRILNFILLMTAVEMKLEFWILFFLISVAEMECKFLILFMFMAITEIELKLNFSILIFVTELELESCCFD